MKEGYSENGLRNEEVNEGEFYVTGSVPHD